MPHKVAHLLAGNWARDLPVLLERIDHLAHAQGQHGLPGVPEVTVIARGWSTEDSYASVGEFRESLHVAGFIREIEMILRFAGDAEPAGAHVSGTVVLRPWPMFGSRVVLVGPLSLRPQMDWFVAASRRAARRTVPFTLWCMKAFSALMLAAVALAMAGWLPARDEPVAVFMTSLAASVVAAPVVVFLGRVFLRRPRS